MDSAEVPLTKHLPPPRHADWTEVSGARLTSCVDMSLSITTSVLLIRIQKPCPLTSSNRVWMRDAICCFWAAGFSVHCFFLFRGLHSNNCLSFKFNRLVDFSSSEILVNFWFVDPKHLVSIGRWYRRACRTAFAATACQLGKSCKCGNLQPSWVC